MKTLLLALLLGGAASLPAQSKAIAPSPSRLFAAEVRGVPVAPATDTVPKPVGDHRWTGAAIGAIAGGALGYVIHANTTGGGACPASGGCYGGSEFPGAVIGGVMLGAATGYLLGATTTKGSLPDAPTLEPVPEDTGLTPAQGAGIGALIGGALFAYLGKGGNIGDGEPPIVGISLGVLIGAFVGGGLARE